jgi:predicted nucleic-acid-binding Zn-ribbon protein
MKTQATCPKCGSGQIIREVQTLDRSDSGNQPLSLRRGTRTWAGWLRLPRTFPVDAWVCGGCGYTELYVREPAQLAAADDGGRAPSLMGTDGAPSAAGSPAVDQTRTALIVALLAGLLVALGLLAVLALLFTR